VIRPIRRSTPPLRRSRPATRSLRRDRGAATSLSLVLLAPVFVVLGFMAFQAAMWSHTRTEVRVVARDTASLVARSGAAPGDARSSAEGALAAASLLRDIEVVIDESPSLVTVTIRGSAPGIVRGTRSTLSVTAAVPVEGWAP
jgi:Flp pilus assembly protein TadG